MSCHLQDTADISLGNLLVISIYDCKQHHRMISFVVEEYSPMVVKLNHTAMLAINSTCIEGCRV